MKYKVVGSMTGLCLALMMATSASAGWGYRGGYSSGYGSYGSSSGYSTSYGSSGGYRAAYGSSGGRSYAARYGSSGGYVRSVAYSSYGGSSGYRPGPVRRVASAVRSHFVAKRVRRASYYSSGGSSYGSSGGYSTRYGSSGGYSSSYGSSGGYSSSYGSSGGYTSSYPTYSSSYGSGSSGGSVSYGSTGGVSYSAPVETHSVGGVYYGASAAPQSSSMILASSSEVYGDSVSLTVSVPSDAKIFVNGNATTSKGALRQFVSKGLVAGKDYRFQLRAELEAVDGSIMTEEKELVVTAGSTEHVQFAFSDSDAAVETAVTLNVPEGAEVRLAGSKTNIAGSQRVYRTSRMKLGDVWDDYEIEVSLNGQTKRQNIRLIAGDRLQLTFQFGDDSTADRIASR